MTAVKDLVPDDYNDDPNYDYQLTSALDHEDLKDARALAEANIATAGSSVPQASTMRAGNTTPRATPATELSGRVDDDADVKRVDLSPATASVAVAATTTVTAAVTPSSATNDEVTFTSSHTGIATVNSTTGVVTGVAVNTKATATVTSNATNVSANDTVTVNGVVYKFVAVPADAYDVDIGASAAASLDNLKAAINATGTEGTTYGTGTLVHPTVEATTNTDTVQTLQAKTGGPDGNNLTLAKSAATLTVTAFTGGYDDTTITGTTTDGGFTDTTVVTVTAS